jgi:prenyltransferase beta subunit
MRYGLRVPTIIILLGLGAAQSRAQTAADFAQTAAYVAGHQNADGGFAASPGQPSTLAATNTALRVLHYVGGSVPDRQGCIRFVKSCKIPGGGFAQTPGGKPDVNKTALGLIAAAELKIDDKAMIDDAVAYLGAHARSFEDVRISVGGIEAVGAKSPEYPRWLKQIEAMRRPDGSFGEGPSQAYDTGAAAAAILRMGIVPDRRDVVSAVIKAGQRPDGAWSKDAGPSDLASTTRVMRALYMLEEKPDEARLLDYIARCRQPDGSYSNTPGGPGSLGSTYFATILLRWLRLLDGKPPVLASAEFTPLFSGRDLNGWEGSTALWSARDGVLVGKSPGLDHAEFLATKRGYRNFILSLSFRAKQGRGHSGIRFRSVRVHGAAMSGYRADIGENARGPLHDASRRKKALADGSARALEPLKEDGWNHYILCAAGDSITLYLNGVAADVYCEETPDIARDGQIALELSGGGPMEVEFKDIRIRVLP